MGDRVHLQQVLLNLLMNAMDAVATMPTERRRVRVCTTQSDGEVRLAVSDSGSGIPADRMSEIFEPFYTTKSAAAGWGWGSRSLAASSRPTPGAWRRRTTPLVGRPCGSVFRSSARPVRQGRPIPLAELLKLGRQMTKVL